MGFELRHCEKVDGREFFMATLSDDKYPHYRTDLYLEKEFELLHSSKTRSISIIGNNFSNLEKKSDTSGEQVNKGKEAESSAEKLAALPGPAAIQSSTSKGTMDPRKLQTDVGGSDDDNSDEDYVDSEQGETSDDEDFSGEDGCESSNEDEDFPKSAKDKNRPAAKTLKTPPEKKAKMTTPSKGKNTD